MPNKPSLVTNTSPLVALTAALDNFGVVGTVATLVVPGEVLAELRSGAGRDATARMKSKGIHLSPTLVAESLRLSGET